MLAEDSYGGGYAGLGLDTAMGGAQPYGAHYASGDQMYNIFVKPFVDVVGVAAGKTKELSTKAQTVVKVAFETIATTLVPVLKDSYEQIFAEEKQKIDQIRSEYASVYGATWEAFAKDDFMIAAFMYRPDLFLTAGLVKKAPKVAAKLLSVLSGGSLDRVLSKIFKGENRGRNEALDLSFGPPLLKEEGEKKDAKDKADPMMTKLLKLISNDKVQQAIANNQKTKAASKVGQELVQGTLTSVFEQAKGVLSAKTLADVQRVTGKKIDGMDELAKVPEQERKVAEQQLLKGVRAGMKAFYVKQLEAQAKAAVEAGVPKDHPFVSDYASVIQKIKAL
jgi:hypothetical protein